jgi:hypothetical protein
MNSFKKWSTCLSLALGFTTHARISVYADPGFASGTIVQQQLVNGKWRIQLQSTATLATTWWHVDCTSN